jgi:hypothetical protein
MHLYAVEILLKGEVGAARAGALPAQRKVGQIGPQLEELAVGCQERARGRFGRAAVVAERAVEGLRHAPFAPGDAHLAARLRAQNVDGRADLAARLGENLLGTRAGLVDSNFPACAAWGARGSKPRRGDHRD